ncbi:TRAP transporter large permease [Candidatus Entotheonella palauensis]|uniref:TRAP transporter large permease n=1 Tax=Candidatus Entotheonella palauensis TaxID=93172 RepID=UPI000B7C5A03|nr:TRAP transporter large permease [Candidatus Entotheonella palauensis]
MVLLVAAILMTIFFLAGLYVATALGLIGMSLMQIFSDRPLWDMLGQIAWNTNSSFILVAVPLFIMMGEILVRSGIADRMYRILSNWLAPIPGGLLHSNIASCALFAAVSGSSAATAATIGSVSLPSFREQGYSERIAIGSLAAGGTLGILIPPSISFILYGVLVEESIGRLYLAGFIPGFLLTVVFMALIALMAKIWPNTAPREVAPPWRVRLIGLLALTPIFALMFIVLGTIYAGIATPTEAAAFGVVASFILAAIERQLNLSMLKEVMLSTVRSSCMIMLIVTAAFILNFALSILGVPTQVSQFVASLNLSPVTFVLFLILFYLLLGTFMEALSMIVTTIPILVPALQAAGVDMVWFGVIVVILMEAALISPPEGINLYVIHGIRKTVMEEAGEEPGTIMDLWLGVLPFMLGQAIVITLLVIFPGLALWLPNLVKGLQ